MVSVYTLLGVSTPFDPEARLVTSWLLPPRALAALRLTLGTYALATIFAILGLSPWPANAREP